MFEEILRVIVNDLISKYGGSVEETDPSKQLLIYLWYMANQDSMREIAVQFGIGLSTVRGIIKRVNAAVCKRLNKVIQWPDFATLHRISREFQLQSGIPDYSFYELQMVVDNILLIRDAFTGFPGCTHDARFLRNSSLFQILKMEITLTVTNSR
ncbi:hypothetical protein KUTeg_022200 [Tegillarca granosa]|uniref:Transposase n=1 Tax=Tegillarca granosa TaxID=220873 RepID=A0ABQ9E5J5_TEGGR|nr:hypothetical protein KUTeg_022200 [Tegillarca granosa]